jgi:sensor histidine kinase YesM
MKHRAKKVAGSHLFIDRRRDAGTLIQFHIPDCGSSVP